LAQAIKRTRATMIIRIFNGSEYDARDSLRP